MHNYRLMYRCHLRIPTEYSNVFLMLHYCILHILSSFLKAQNGDFVLFNIPFCVTSYKMNLNILSLDARMKESNSYTTMLSIYCKHILDLNLHHRNKECNFADVTCDINL